MVGGKAAAEAGAVTCGAVRCSAWLGFIAVGSAGGVFRAKVVGFSFSLPSVFHDAFRIGDFSGWLFGLVITGEGGEFVLASDARTRDGHSGVSIKADGSSG